MVSYLAFIFFLGLILFAGLLVFREISYRRKMKADAFYPVYRLLKMNRPVASNEWTIQPDCAEALVRRILEKKPNLILEAGCGISTLFVAYALKQNKKGCILALEHKENHAASCREKIAGRRLKKWAQVLHAPLAVYPINGREWKWYSTQELPPGPVEMIIVDGPPGDTQPQARYPALPLFFSRLPADAEVFLDDMPRADEQEILKVWLREFPAMREVLPRSGRFAILKKIS